jgi:hypothetical protein
MRANLQQEHSQAFFWSGLGWGPKNPHLVYANHDFIGGVKDELFSQLVEMLDNVSSWEKTRIIEYLKTEQETFRKCLEWLSGDARVYVNGHVPLRMLNAVLTRSIRRWEKRDEVKFLQLHGVKHARLELRPSPTGPVWEGSRTCMIRGLGLAQRRERDPLDLLCWDLIGLAQRNLLKVRRCGYPGCRIFFEPPTPRKFYCSDNCRAKAHKKSPKEMTLYMRNYRAIKRRLKSSSHSALK